MVLPLIHGIGYDHLRDDYKVIRHVQFDSRFFEHLFDRELFMEEELSISKEPLWEIYSLRSNSWKKLEVDMSMVMNPKDEEDIAQFYMDGMCHWWDNVEKDSSDETYFVSFDVSNEVFFTTPMPSQVDYTFDLRLVKRQLMMLNGSIALISYSGETATLHVSILGEIVVKESWTKLFIVGPVPHVHCPIGAGKNGDIFLKNNDEELACFNLVTQTINELGVEGLMSQIVIYKESLLFIRGINK
jgi:molecular chaperone HtpG